METIMHEMSTALLHFAKNLIGSVVILVVGLYLAKIITRICTNAMVKAKLELTVVSFLKSVISSVLKIIVALSVLSTLGFPTTSLVAIFGTAGAAFALGFKDTLGSFMSGIIILFSKPFKVGDYVLVNQVEGNVKEIQVMYTILTTIDNKVVIVPNSKMTTNIVINYSNQEHRRLDITFDVAYDSNIDLVKEVIHQVINEQSTALKEPAPFVRVSNYLDSSIEILVRVWCKNQDYLNLKFDLLEQIKVAFDKHDIEIPYNRIDVNFKQTN